MITKKEFALKQIAPYFKDPSTCGHSGNSCVNLTQDGRMCVAGKNYLPEVREKFPTGTVYNVLSNFSYNQSKVFIPESVDILTVDEWSKLQHLHDSIAKYLNFNHEINALGLFTPEELKEYAKTI